MGKWVGEKEGISSREGGGAEREEANRKACHAVRRVNKIGYPPPQATALAYPQLGLLVLGHPLRGALLRRQGRGRLPGLRLPPEPSDGGRVHGLLLHRPHPLLRPELERPQRLLLQPLPHLLGEEAALALGVAAEAGDLGWEGRG